MNERQTPGFRAVLATCVLLCVPASEPVSASTSCSRQWVCIAAVESVEDVEFHAENLTPWPLTLTIDFDLENLGSAKQGPITRTITGGDRVLLQSMARRDPARRYHYRYWFDWTPGRLQPDHSDDYIYRLPFASGTRFRLLQGFGSRFSHTGRERYALDFDMPEGTAVHAARGGVVVMVVEDNDRGCWQDGCGRFANYLVVLHDDDTTGEYYHLAHQGALVEVGERIERGQRIARSGNTGHTTMPHLHFAVYRADTWGRTQSLKIRFQTTAGVVRRLSSGDWLGAD